MRSPRASPSQWETLVPRFGGNTVDVMFVYESNGLPTPSSLDRYRPFRNQVGLIPLNVAGQTGNSSLMSQAAVDWVKAVKPSAKYIYVTHDALPNPWDALASYFDDLLRVLEAP
jgi:hypothetical protein